MTSRNTPDIILDIEAKILDICEVVKVQTSYLDHDDYLVINKIDVKYNDFCTGQWVTFWQPSLGTSSIEPILEALQLDWEEDRDPGLVAVLVFV